MAVSTSALESVPETKKPAASPGQRVLYAERANRSAKKWHYLFESGAISKEEHDKFQKTIVLDIKELQVTLYCAFLFESFYYHCHDYPHWHYHRVR